VIPRRRGRHGKIYGPYFMMDENGEEVFLPTLKDKRRYLEMINERRVKREAEG